MVKVKGQLASLDASGSVAKTLTFSSWKGRPYVKQFKVPTNPNTPGQIGLRQAMTFLSSQWPTLSEPQRQTWWPLAAHRGITMLDSYNSINLERFSNGTGLSKEYPPPEASNAINMLPDAPVAFDRYVELSAVTFPVDEAWGYIFYQDASSGFTPGPANAVAVILGTGFFTKHTARVVPPHPGTWYSRYATFNDSGTIHLVLAEKSVVWGP